MSQQRGGILVVVLLCFGTQWTGAYTPKFAIGEDYRSYYSKHHIPSHEQRDYYHVYVRENTKDLIVEPRIQVLPSVEATSVAGRHASPTTTITDDVCDYKILPSVRGPAAVPVTAAASNGSLTADSAGRPGDLMDDEKPRNPAGTGNDGVPGGEDEYSDDDEDSDDSEEEVESEALPFTIRPSKEDKHEAVLEATKKLNCEHRGRYEFDIVAVSCAGEVSKSVKVVVKVEDVNEYEPKFSQTSYQASLEEGRLVDSIVQVQAFDEDCSEDYSKIARYELLEPRDDASSPFAIDETTGSVRNLRPLNYTRERRFFLTVMAYDAGGKKSLYPATVEINVLPGCQARWEGMPERVDYVPDSTQVKLTPDAQLELCPASVAATLGCSKIEKITGHVTLRNDHIGKGCDREDKLPLQVMRKRCSSKMHPHSSLIELLPGKPSNQANYPKRDSNTTTHGSNILKFDGTASAVILTSDKINPDTFNRSFTITTWLKREAPVNRTYDHKFPKEHILCISDDHERSRHHVALYVRNCRLGLLLRREPRAGDQVTVFRPAEWRWNLDSQLCGGEWHHYAISVKYPDVKLFIDGKEFEDDSATEIIDDWALHPIKGLQTTSVVGACWQGGQNRMDQFLNGYLDGLSVLVNETEEESVLQCMQKCAERLTVPDSAASSQAVFSLVDADENEMLVEGYETSAFANLIKQISYENDRMYPTPGVRFVDIRTSFQCTKTQGNRSEVVIKDLPPVSMRVEVAEAIPPTVTLSGPATLTIDGMDNPDSSVFQTGIKILDSLTISVMRASAAAQSRTQKDTKIPDYETLVRKFSREEILLDLCTVSLRDQAGHDDVTLVVSDALAKPLSMEVRQTKDTSHEKQWTIQGTGATNEIPDFLSVLRDVRLKFVDGLQLKHREIVLSVSLVCVEMFSKIPSAQYTVEVDLKNFKHFEKLETPTVHVSAEVRRTAVAPAHLAVHTEHVPQEHAPMVRLHDRDREMDAFYGPHSVFSVPQFRGGPDVGHMTSTGLAITVVVIVCVSFFIFLVFAGVMKIRSIHNRTKLEEDPELQDVHSRAKRSKLSLRALRKLRKSLNRKRNGSNTMDPMDDEEMDDEDVDLKMKQKSDMAWDDSGMSITVNPLEETQVPISDCEFDDHDEDAENYYDDGDMSEEEKENDTACTGRVVQEDEDSANECEECSKPNRGVAHCATPPNIRRSQSCVETFTKSKDGRMTRSDLEWDDQI